MRHLTCLVKDDFTNLLLLYRKLASTNYDNIAIYTAYDRKTQRFIIDAELLKCFPNLTYIGPTPIYEDYVTFANFPVEVDLNNYNENFVNINMIEHLKHHHIDDIYPAQKTDYHHKLHITPEFQIGKSRLNPNVLNICINIFDPMYDQSFAIQYNLVYCLSQIQDHYKDVEVHLLGIQNDAYAPMVLGAVEDALSISDIKLHNHLTLTFSEQLSIMMHSDGIISCPFGMGVLAYTTGTPAFIIYPFHLEYMIGKTINPNKANDTYIESTDVDYIDDIDKFIDKVGVSSGRNRRSNI